MRTVVQLIPVSFLCLILRTRLTELDPQQQDVIKLNLCRLPMNRLFILVLSFYAWPVCCETRKDSESEIQKIRQRILYRSATCLFIFQLVKEVVWIEYDYFRVLSHNVNDNTQGNISETRAQGSGDFDSIARAVITLWFTANTTFDGRGI